MRNLLVRFAVSACVALLGFALVSLLTVYLASSSARMPVQALLPKVDEAQARILLRTITPEITTELQYAPSGVVVFVQGHAACTSTENIRITVEVNQSSTGAHATGATLDPCTGAVQIWDAVATVRGSGPGFEPGSAWVCAVATSRKGGLITDTYSWCKQVTLSRQ